MQQENTPAKILAIKQQQVKERENVVVVVVEEDAKHFLLETTSHSVQLSPRRRRNIQFFKFKIKADLNRKVIETNKWS